MTDEIHVISKLQSIGYSSYREYLNSDHWKTTRKNFFSRSQRIIKMKREGGICCEFCRTSGKINLHHKTYERLGCERTTDLIILCDGCHQTVHDLNRSVSLPTRTKQVRKLLKITQQKE